MLELVIHPQGNKREVPPDVPIGYWLDEMRELASRSDRDELLAELAWTHPVMEYLEPALLVRFKVQALVWRQHTGAFPEEVAYWWPVRLGRRRGQVPHMFKVAEAIIDTEGTLHCGFCEARWSAHHDGSPYGIRCKLCDRLWTVVLDERRIG